MKKLLLLSWGVLLLCITQLYAQTRTVTGKVTAQSDGLPIPGVSVTVKGTTTGTQTDANGNFSLNAPNSARVLVFTYIGFKPQEVVIASGTLGVVLQEDQKSLSEVVITGYQTQSRREVSGSIATVNAAQVAQVPIASFDQALQGRAAGVLVTANSGQPGSSAVITIRGNGSINGSTTPLYILDGIEITARDFSTLNPNDFATFNILKDAAATSQYGSRGSNGVVVVTSKQGLAGRPVIRYDLQLGRSLAPENKLKVMNTEQKLDYELVNGNPNGWSDDEIAAFRNINTDWADVLFKKGTTKSHNLSVSGGADKTKYLISGSLFDQSGTVPTTKLKRYNGRVNLSSGTKDLDFGINSTIGYSDFKNTSEANTGINAPLNAVMWTNPYLAPYTATGAYSQNPTGQPNPLPELLENVNLSGQLKAVGNAFVNYRVPVVPGLFVKVNGGADYTTNESSAFIDPITYTGSLQTGQRGSLARNYNKFVRYTLTSSIGYSRTFAEDHTLTATVFNEIVRGKGSTFGFTGYGLGGAFENEAGITPGNTTNNFIPLVRGGGAPAPYGETNALLSYFTIINYGYKGKYFLQLGGRRDGSSRFGANYRYANFGSVGASWVVSAEPFFASLKEAISDLKFKASYGSAGNQGGLGDFQSRELFGRAVYNGVSGLLQGQLAQPDLTWEQRNKLNLGLEFTAWKGRVGGTVEYYNDKTTRLLFPRPISTTTGFGSITTNAGALRNSGIEASLNVDVIKSRSFTWNLFGNFTYNKNRVLELVNGQNEIVQGTLAVLRPNEALNSLYLVRYQGVNPANGNSVYLDKNGNPTETYSASDRVIVGTTDAPYFGGFGSGVSYKGLELNVLFSYVTGNKIYNNDRTNVENPDYLFDNLSADLLREWRTPGQITDIPRADQPIQTATTRFVEDGKFLRLRNVTLSYELPKRWVSAIKLNSVRVFAQGQNLATWTKFKGYDPEITGGVLTGAQYPALRTYTAGLSVGF
jgi:TonB-dependent starch-binding outer membrane protein SusC